MSADVQEAIRSADRSVLYFISPSETNFLYGASASDGLGLSIVCPAGFRWADPRLLHQPSHRFGHNRHPTLTELRLRLDRRLIASVAGDPGASEIPCIEGELRNEDRARPTLSPCRRVAYGAAGWQPRHHFVPADLIRGRALVPVGRGRSIDGDRRLAKQAITVIIEVFAFRLRLAVESWRPQAAPRWREETRGRSVA